MAPNKSHDRNVQRIDRRSFLREGVIVAGGLSLGIGPATAENKPFEATIDPTGLERFLPCTGENVKVTEGKIKVKIETHSDGNGGVHFSYHSHWKPRGVGVGQDSGIEWTVQGTKSITENLRPPFPQTFTRVDNSNFTSNGSDQNFLYRQRTYTTVNAEGGITAFNDEESLKCTGSGTNQE